MTQTIAAATLDSAPPIALFDRKSFADALSRVVRVVEKRNTIPILANVRLVGTGESVIIEGCDLDTWSRVTIPAAADSRFGVTVPAHLLRDAVKRAASEYVEATPGVVTIGEGEHASQLHNVYLDFEGAKTALQALPIEDWPCVENIERFKTPAVASFTLPTATLRRLIEVCSPAISTEETRYYLNGIYMHATKDGYGANVFRAVATDGHRLAQATIAVPAGAEGLAGIIVPRNTVGLVHAELKRKGAAESVSIEVGATWIAFTIGNAVIRSKLIDGTFPDYCRVVPAAWSKVATVDSDKFAAMVKAVSTISSERGRAVRLAFDVGRVTATVNNPDAGSASQGMQCELVSTSDAPTLEESAALGIDIGFNARYLLDLVELIGADKIAIQMTDPGSPTRILPTEAMADGVDVLTVLMPMRV